MAALLLMGKVVGSVLLSLVLIVGSIKANRNWHVPANRPMVEFATGFVLFFIGVAGIFYIWN
ncbi:hypothetical protein ACNKU7_12535 [Microbulbifer sp. SA54]|uniref:hypothetical protein n=1 Tax=Microbulbifer sp. SA54 TaxID=3401577 RepID=UPI003AABCF84